MDNLEEMDKFLETCNLQKLNQEEVKKIWVDQLPIIKLNQLKKKFPTN